jgi:hypothetical protein
MHMQIRDLRLLPVKARSILSTRRSVRKKIHERITAIYCKDNLVPAQIFIHIFCCLVIICIFHFHVENIMRVCPILSIHGMFLSPTGRNLYALLVFFELNGMLCC